MVVGIDGPWLFNGKTKLDRRPGLEGIASFYNGLWELTHEHGHGAAFDTGLLIESFVKHDPAAKDNGFLYGVT